MQPVRVLLDISSQDRSELLLALQIAIGHESDVVSRLQADEEFRSLTEAVRCRLVQIRNFENLRKSLSKGPSPAYQRPDLIRSTSTIDDDRNEGLTR